jgi:hypothetical protein
MQVGALVFPATSVPRTHTWGLPAFANGPRVTWTFSVGSSNTPSLAFIGIHAPPSICTSAAAIDESPVAVSSTVAISAAVFLTAITLGIATTLATIGAATSEPVAASGAKM